MKRATLTLVALLATMSQGLGQDPSRPEEPVQELVATCNYLTSRLVELGEGRLAAGVKDEILNDLDLARLPDHAVALFGRTIAVCDRVAAIESERLALAEDQRAQADKDALGNLVAGVIDIAATGGTVTGAMALLDLLLADPAAEGASVNPMALAENQGLVSGINLDLAVLRSNLIAEHEVKADSFLIPRDLAELASATQIQDVERRILAVEIVQRRQPLLQLAALFLGGVYFLEEKFDASAQLADQAIAASPAILVRDRARAEAYYLKCLIADKRGNEEALMQASKSGLRDKPDHEGLRRIRYYSLAKNERHGEAIQDIEELVAIGLANATDFYNLACCQAVTQEGLDDAFRSLRISFGSGFTEVAHARQDPDLEALRAARAQEFENLTQMRLSPSIEWHAIGHDQIHLENESAFTLVDLKARLKISPKGSGRSISKTIEIDSLAPGAVAVVSDLLDTTQGTIAELEISASGPQGESTTRYDGDTLTAVKP